ncbi:MAG: helix-turn-helix domain-containing protein [Microcystaceae cyanobacterium]
MKPELLATYTHNKQILQQLMEYAQIETFEALSKQSGVSQWQLNRLLLGLMPKLTVENLVKLSSALKIPVDKCLALFYPNLPSIPSPEITQPNEPSPSKSIEELEQLKGEYERLQQQLEQQKETLKQEFQQSSLEVLESWLLQWPTAAAAAQKNPKLSAVKLLVLVKPVVELLKRWGVENIGIVGEKIPYDPISHQLLEGTAVTGELVEVRYVGYRQDDKLLYRAKVSPVK